MNNQIGLYIHIPWCIKKCPYCDFNSHAIGSKTPETQYIETLLADLQQDLALLDRPVMVGSIFIGGGTPSLFSAQAFELLLAGIDKLIPLQAGLEITLEANPGTFESEKFSAYRKIGINRLSIGIQSFNDHHLTALGRVHSATEALAAVDIAQQAGFDNLNLDLMFGLPAQTLEQMQDDVSTAISLQPSHISYYQLTLEPNTYFHKFPPKLPEDDDIYSGQLNCQRMLAEAGYIQYEISAYAQVNKQCKHNLNYWRFGDYLGIGAGAHGKITRHQGTMRTTKHKRPEQYLQDSAAMTTWIASEELPLEYLMNQLRLKAGFNLEHYQQRTGLDSATLEPALSQCVAENLLIRQGVDCYCSKRGWHFIDHILEKFIA